jgi:hypothetical protein
MILETPYDVAVASEEVRFDALERNVRCIVWSWNGIEIFEDKYIHWYYEQKNRKITRDQSSYCIIFFIFLDSTREKLNYCVSSLILNMYYRTY